MGEVYCSWTAAAVVRNPLPTGFHLALPLPAPDQSQACFMPPRLQSPRFRDWLYLEEVCKIRHGQNHAPEYIDSAMEIVREQKCQAVWAAQLFSVLFQQWARLTISWHKYAWRSILLMGHPICIRLSRPGSS